jgi:tetratricopeptide (TPR) repeat protein
MRPPRIFHCTSEPYQFFGRPAELALLDESLAGGPASVVALVGPGGQGKTAIAQHWLASLDGPGRPDGTFLWSFYRGKDADLCLRAWLGYAEGSDRSPDVSASYCVDRLLPRLRRERWAVVLDGAEVAQHESGPWYGRFVHPELGRLLEELASAPTPGVVVLTTRFPLPTLEKRGHLRLVSLASLDAASARGLLRSLGVWGDDGELDAVAEVGGHHAKAVELLGTYLVRFHDGLACRVRELPEAPAAEGEASAEEVRVGRVLGAFHRALPAEARDVLALATAFRDPPTEARLLAYLAGDSVRTLLHETWKRTYTPFELREEGWLAQQVQGLIDLRLLERVAGAAGPVIDAHPLVRRGFEGALGVGGRREGARARAGFLRGRPDRRRPDSLEEAREEVELFHAFCDASLWDEADSAFLGLENPKHRFLAPALERDLLLRFFPEGDWRRPPLWGGFGRWRSLAIALELLGDFDSALAVYREADAPLRGDALIALGRLDPLLDTPSVPPPWQTLWRAYRCHALCLAGRRDEAVRLARSLVPVDVYEWVHVFECLLRAGALDALDLRSVLFRPPSSAGHRWEGLARRRLRADYQRLTGEGEELDREYRDLSEAYDRGGLPYERALTRLGHARLLLAHGEGARAREILSVVRDLARRHGMRILECDAREIDPEGAGLETAALRLATGYRAPPRP